LLTNAFFLYYGLPVAITSYAVVAWHLRSRLSGRRIDLDEMDVIDANVEDVRFLQAQRHGDVMTPVELVEGHADVLGGRIEPVIDRLNRGDSLGLALVHEQIPTEVRRLLLGHFVSDELADGLDRHYEYEAGGHHEEAFQAELALDEVLKSMAYARRRAQRLGALALVPFVAGLIAHALNNDIPLFLASFAGFLVALPAIARIPKMRALALREARQEYAEYYFLFPLFLSITLLTSAGFFDVMQSVVQEGKTALGSAHVAQAQFVASTFLSAILDNNIVADFASRGLHGLETRVVHFFAMAQIAGYALGGCWTHIGCAQSVVAFAFIQRDVDPDYTPIQWIRDITPVILQMMAIMTVLIYAENAVLRSLASGPSSVSVEQTVAGRQCRRSHNGCLPERVSRPAEAKDRRHPTDPRPTVRTGVRAADGDAAEMANEPHGPRRGWLKNRNPPRGFPDGSSVHVSAPDGA
jgi:hypothetical protein